MIDLYNEMNVHIQMIHVNTPDIWNKRQKQPYEYKEAAYY